VAPADQVAQQAPIGDVVRRLHLGDHDAVQALYARYGRSVWAVAYRILGRRDLAADATQQTFVQAWQHAGDLDPDRDPAPWLHTVARRTAIGILRKEHRDRWSGIEDAEALPSADGDQVVGTWELWQVREAVDALPPDEREAVRLTAFEGYTHSEVAERLGVPIGTVKSRLGRAFRRLATALQHVRDGPAP
jgi:RNA polymerase sigma-70 factor (ECF subfamily)